MTPSPTGRAPQSVVIRDADDWQWIIEDGVEVFDGHPRANARFLAAIYRRCGVADVVIEYVSIDPYTDDERITAVITDPSPSFYG